MSYLVIVFYWLAFPIMVLLLFLLEWSHKKDQRKRTLLIFGMGVVLYVGVYVILSVNGGYRWTMSGNHRIHGWAPSDQQEWFPAGTDWHWHIGIKGKPIIWDERFPNAFFAGLIEVDRLVWHKTVPMLQ